MGCSHDKNELLYMRPNPNAKQIKGETISHVNNYFPYVNKYVEESESTSILNLALESFSKNSSNYCLGYRKQISSTEYSKKYTFFTFKDIHHMISNLSHNIKIHKLVQNTHFQDDELFTLPCLYFESLESPLQFSPHFASFCFKIILKQKYVRKVNKSFFSKG